MFRKYCPKEEFLLYKKKKEEKEKSQRPFWKYRFLGPPSIQCSRSVVSDSAAPWTAARQASLFIANFRSLLKLMFIESVMSSSHLILCCPLLLLPLIFPSIRVFSNESVRCLRWPKYWSFSFSISPSNEYSELISFRMCWLALLAGQRTLKSLLQYHSSKVPILWPSLALFICLGWSPHLFGGGMLQGLWDLSSLSRDWTQAHDKESPTCWTTRELSPCWHV